MGFWSGIANTVTGAYNAVTGSALGTILSNIMPWLGPILNVISIISVAITWLRKPDEPDFNVDTTPENRAKGVLVNKTSANAQIPVIYGTRKVGGTIAFMETSGTDNEFLYMIMALAEGEIDDITTIYINDNAVTWSGDLSDGTSS